MTEKIKAPTWFWILAVIALIWNALGVYQYLDQVMSGPEALETLPEAERVLVESLPMWITSAFAVAVWAGLLASLFLLMRKKLAYPLFLISLAGILVQMIGSLLTTDSMEVYGAQVLFMTAMLIAFAVALVLVSRTANSKGWTN